MSTALAIAGVTQVLRDLLNNGIVDNDVSAVVGQSIQVRTVPPDRLQTEATAADPVLNLFMHRVTPNLGWVNDELPVRDSKGRLVQKPRLALDLHYLLTAFGFDDLHGEILLGYAMQILHENPMLSRAQIRDGLDPNPTIGGTLPAPLQALNRSGLADQIEQIRVTAEHVSNEEMSHVWSSLNTNYRPTTAYRASVVLIESPRPTRSPSPVLTLGPQDRGPEVLPSTVPPLPTITAVTLPAKQDSVRLGETFVVSGRFFGGTGIQAVITHPRLADPLVLPPTGTPTASRIEFAIPDDATTAVEWAAGAVQLVVEVVPPGANGPRTSNVWPLLVAPIAEFGAASATRTADGVEVALPVRPEVRDGQAVSLALGTVEAVLVDGSAGATVDFVFPDSLAAGTHPARLRVDGVDSWMILKDLPPIGPDFLPRSPELDPGESVTVPP